MSQPPQQDSPVTITVTYTADQAFVTREALAFFHDYLEDTGQETETCDKAAALLKDFGQQDPQEDKDS